MLLGWMVAGLLLSQTVCFDHWKTRLPLGHCLASSWQRRCQRWLSNARVDAEGLYGPLILWAIQDWQRPGQALHLALDTTMLWNRICVVVVSVVCHGRAMPLLWQALEHPSASVSAEVSIGLLEKADRLLADFGVITLLADRAFPCAELLGWLEKQPGCPADARRRCLRQVDDLAADPAPGAGTLHPKPQEQGQAGPSLVLAD